MKRRALCYSTVIPRRLLRAPAGKCASTILRFGRSSKVKPRRFFLGVHLSNRPPQTSHHSRPSICSSATITWQFTHCICIPNRRIFHSPVQLLFFWGTPSPRADFVRPYPFKRGHPATPRSSAPHSLRRPYRRPTPSPILDASANRPWSRYPRGRIAWLRTACLPWQAARQPGRL